jgi:4-methylaminobutanoate oxidase (formaldehyde-forming)
MGPDAARIATECGAPELNDLGYFKHGGAYVCGRSVLAARMSYVGEAGWEISCLSKDASDIYAAFTAAGARPAGLFAQTSMRIEKAFCAMGHELDSDISPIEVGLDFATRKSGGFSGFSALEEKRALGAFNRVISLILEDVEAVPLGHEPVYLNGEIIGQTSSCAFGHRVGKPIALASADTAVREGTRVQLDIGRRLFDATVRRGPIFDPDGSRMKI